MAKTRAFVELECAVMCFCTLQARRAPPPAGSNVVSHAVWVKSLLVRRPGIKSVLLTNQGLSSISLN